MKAKHYLEIILLLSSLLLEAECAVDCKEKGAGRFADPDDETCKIYDLCVYVPSSNTYQTFNYTCPEETYFDPDTEVCSDSYECPNKKTATCETPGRIPDPSDSTCQKYYMCYEVDGEILSYPYECPGSTVFNPDTEVCTSESNYECPT